MKSGQMQPSSRSFSSFSKIFKRCVENALIIRQRSSINSCYVLLAVSCVAKILLWNLFPWSNRFFTFVFVSQKTQRVLIERYNSNMTSCLFEFEFSRSNYQCLAANFDCNIRFDATDRWNRTWVCFARGYLPTNFLPCFVFIQVCQLFQVFCFSEAEIYL